MFAQPAQADPMVWTLEGVTFDTGATATGSFNYDAATNHYQNVNISVTKSGLLDDLHYTTIELESYGADFLYFSLLQVWNYCTV